MRVRFLAGLIGFSLAFFIAACGRDRTQVAMPTPPTATATPMTLAEATPAPTVTRQVTLPPPPTVVPSSPTSQPTSSPTPPPTPTATSVALLEAADFAADRNPLTGELMSDRAVLSRRPIAVKISNSPPEHTRPQAGLSQADLVFEHVTEGAITRFTAIFFSQTPPDVGPIRSARLIDVELPAMYDAALAYSGASIGVAQRLNRSDFRERLIRSNDPGYYRTGEDKPWEHTLYGKIEGFRESLSAAGLELAPTFGTYMTFTGEPPPGGEAATTLQFRYRTFTTVDWRYDATDGRYWRWVDGEPHVDANNDRQLSAANVIAVFAIHQLDRSICEFQQDDQCLSFSTEIQIWLDGPAIIFRDGRRYEGRWRRDNRNDMLTFYDDTGAPIPLQIGNSWIQAVPLHYSDPVSSQP